MTQPAPSTPIISDPTPVQVPAPSASDAVRRAVDLVVGTVGLIVGGPIMAILAIIIRMGTPGPALFRQERVGRGGRRFVLVKFRTLYADARERFPELYDYRFTPADLESTPFKPRVDPRVTPQGRWIRRTSLDELPNLWNVVRGDMTLVGPRPEIPEMLGYYAGDMAEVFTVKPGLTGAAQVSGRGDLSIAEAIRIDVAYLRRRTILSDFGILARTLVAVLGAKGAF